MSRLMIVLVWSMASLEFMSCKDSSVLFEGASGDVEPSSVVSDSASSDSGDTDTDVDSDTDTDTGGDTDSGTANGDSDTKMDTDTDGITPTDLDDDFDTDTGGGGVIIDAGRGSDGDSGMVVDDDANTNTDTEADVDTDTHTDAESDVDGGSQDPANDDTDFLGPYTQDPVVINIINRTGENRYIDKWATRAFLTVDYLKDGVWVPYQTNLPPCNGYCESLMKDESCCVAGCSHHEMIFVLKGDVDFSMENNWIGQLLSLNEDWCSDCSCYNRQMPLTGTYRGRACVYRTVDCGTVANCEQSFSFGPSPIGSVTGDAVCYSVEFNVPYKESALDLVLNDDSLIK